MSEPAEKSPWETKAEEDGAEAARQVSDFLNVLGVNTRQTAFIAAMGREHRTLQQGFTQLCVDWLRECARKLEARDFDLRNEASCRLGAKFVEAAGDAMYLPLV